MRPFYYLRLAVEITLRLSFLSLRFSLSVLLACFLIFLAIMFSSKIQCLISSLIIL